MQLSSAIVASCQVNWVVFVFPDAFGMAWAGTFKDEKLS